MDFLNFAIPSKMENLLSDSNDYYVKAIIGPKSINEQLTSKFNYLYTLVVIIDIVL